MPAYWRSVLYLVVLLVLFLMPQTYASLSNSTFTSAEHVIMGNEVALRFGEEEPGQTGFKFHLPSGLDLTYGDIISIGDLYGIPDKPVSKAHGEYARKSRFMAAFNLFAANSSPYAKEAEQVLAAIHDEQREVSDGMALGQNPEDIYKHIADVYDRRLNCITGGSCASSSWWLNPGRYLKLAYNNFDHFGKNAWRTYQTGHAIALEKALKAHATGDIEQLKIAYAINAFATHFLSDRFSSGHIRTPRMRLPRGINPGVVGNLLSNYMHNEENQYGLHVHNKLGQQWIAYGDRSFLNPQYTEHRQILQRVLQASADQVYEAFRTGIVTADDVINYLPHPDESNEHAREDISPLFYWDAQSKKLYRRADLSNPYDRHWTTNWWGLSTLYELRDRHGMKASDEAILALSNYSREALNHGLITNKEMIAYLYHSVS